MILKTKLTNASRSPGSRENMHGNLLDKEGNPDPNTSISINAAKGVGLADLDPDKIYEIEIREVVETTKKK